MESILLSLGSNIEPERHLMAATRRLATRVEILAVSRVYATVPVGVRQGPVFLNAAVEIRCPLSAGDLRHQILRPLEEELGRRRSADRNAPRTLDLDISLFGQRVIRDQALGLEIPDPEILTRAHVAVPLADLAPSVRHPITGQTLLQIAQGLETGGVRIREELALWSQSDRLQA